MSVEEILYFVSKPRFSYGKQCLIAIGLWACLLWLTWFEAADCNQAVLFVAERGLEVTWRP